MISFLLFLLLAFFLGLFFLQIYRTKKPSRLFFFFALISFGFFLLLVYFPLNYFYNFLFENQKKLLKINSLTLLDNSFDYLEVGKNLKNEVVGFYFDEERQEFYYKNLKEAKSFLLDERPTVFFSEPTPFMDLPLANNTVKTEPIFLNDEQDNLIAKLNFDRSGQKKTIPEKGNFHSYTITSNGIIYANPDAKKSNLLKIFHDTFEKNQKVATEVSGNNYYPYYWQQKEILFFLNLSRIKVDEKSTFAYTLIQYDLKENKVLENTLLGGEEKISWRAVKVLGDAKGEYLSYSSLNQENKLYFFYYDSNDVSKKTHFFLDFQDLDEIYSFAFLEKKEDKIEMVLLAKKNNQNQKNLFLATLAKTKVATINVNEIFYVQTALGFISLIFLFLSFYLLRNQKISAKELF